MTHILIAYATWTGSTREVAEAIAETLRGPEITVDLRRAGKVRDLSSYQSVIVGTSAHMGKLPREVRGFVRRHRKTLGQMPTAWFLVCGTMAQNTPENCQTALGYLEPFRQTVPDLDDTDVGLFGGAILTNTKEFDGMFPILKSMVKSTAGEMEDSRDWDAIRDWAVAQRPRLVGA